MAFFKKLRESLKGVREKWSSGLAKLFSSGKFDADFWDNLEEKLIAGDTGLEFTEEIIDYLKDEAKRKKINNPAELKDIFVAKIAGELNSVPGMGKSFNLANNYIFRLCCYGNHKKLVSCIYRCKSQYKYHFGLFEMACRITPLLRFCIILNLKNNIGF